jgi:hypothetical protein
VRGVGVSPLGYRGMFALHVCLGSLSMCACLVVMMMMMITTTIIIILFHPHHAFPPFRVTHRPEWAWDEEAFTRSLFQPASVPPALAIDGLVTWRDLRPPLPPLPPRGASAELSPPPSTTPAESPPGEGVEEVKEGGSPPPTPPRAEADTPLECERESFLQPPCEAEGASEASAVPDVPAPIPPEAAPAPPAAVASRPEGGGDTALMPSDDDDDDDIHVPEPPTQDSQDSQESAPPDCQDDASHDAADPPASLVPTPPPPPLTESPTCAPTVGPVGDSFPSTGEDSFLPTGELAPGELSSSADGLWADCGPLRPLSLAVEEDLLGRLGAHLRSTHSRAARALVERGGGDVVRVVAALHGLLITGQRGLAHGFLTRAFDALTALPPAPVRGRQRPDHWDGDNTTLYLIIAG